MTEYEYEYYSVWKSRPNTNTNIIRLEKSNRIRIRILFGLKKIYRIRIRILFGLKKSPEYECEYLCWASTIRIIFKYRIIRSPLPVMGVIIRSFMGSLIRMLFGLKKKVDRIQIRILFGLKILTEYEYEYYLVWKNRPNTNTNIIWFENIDRIWIRISFGLKKSPEYKYEY